MYFKSLNYLQGPVEANKVLSHKFELTQRCLFLM